MALSLVMANTTIRGHFNPYIVSPEWLAENNIWKSEEIQLAFGSVIDGIRFRSGESDWQVNSNSLQISSLGNCGQLAAEVLKALPHTPVLAVGINFEYSSLEELSKVSPNLGAGFEPPDSLSFEIKKWTGVVHKESNRIEMTVVVGSQGANVSFNHHLAATRVDDILAFTESYQEKKLISDQMILDVLKEKVK